MLKNKKDVKQNDAVKTKNEKKGNNKKKNSSKSQIKKMRDSVPYVNAFPSGIIETVNRVYTKTYSFADTNFQIENEEKQDELFIEYGNLINKFGPSVSGQINIINRPTDVNDIKQALFIKAKNDNLNEYREEYNDILMSEMQRGRNDIKRERFLTIAVQAENISTAQAMFNNIDKEMDDQFLKINKRGCKPLTLTERLELLYEAYNPHTNLKFMKKVSTILDEENEIDFKKLNRGGMISKDLIVSDGLLAERNHIQIGDSYSRTFYLDALPTFLNTDIVKELSSLSCNMSLSVMYRIPSQKKSVKMVKDKITSIDADLINYQKKASEGGYSADLISPELKRAKSEADSLLSEVMSKNQKIVYTTVMVTIYAQTLEQLDELSMSLQSKANDFLCQMKVLRSLQLPSFYSTLPLGNLFIDIDRVLTTDSASVFFPFNMNEILDKNGVFYGLNAISQNMIVYNRKDSKLANGVILGQAGSGKSFSAKNEIIFNYLSTDDDIIIIDPDQEYVPIAKDFGGQVIKISPGTKSYINPLDMDIQYSDGTDPIASKCDFIATICETILGKNMVLTPFDLSIIGRCGKKIYKEYMEHITKLRDAGHDITCDREKMPTLADFYEELTKQPEAEAKHLAITIEPYATGSYDMFAHRTNIDVNSRFIVYDIKHTGSCSKELAMQICLSDIWNRILENKKKNKRTWVYLDEFYLLTQTESSASFLQMVFKRVRKYGGIITGITQDIEDLLKTSEARGILNNCGFMLFMNQSSVGRAELQELYDISPSLLSYITDKPPGTGLLYNGTTIVPFVYKFPKKTQLYKLMSTKPNEE